MLNKYGTAAWDRNEHVSSTIKAKWRITSIWALAFKKKNVYYPDVRVLCQFPILLGKRNFWLFKRVRSRELRSSSFTPNS